MPVSFKYFCSACDLFRDKTNDKNSNLEQLMGQKTSFSNDNGVNILVKAKELRL
jgi:hypothetical protein